MTIQEKIEEILTEIKTEQNNKPDRISTEVLLFLSDTVAICDCLILYWEKFVFKKGNPRIQNFPLDDIQENNNFKVYKHVENWLTLRHILNWILHEDGVSGMRCSIKKQAFF